jgi:hypothetical protein
MGADFILWNSIEKRRDRSVMGLGVGRAPLFYEIAKLIEAKIGQSCGITDQSQMDEYLVDGAVFTHFFEEFMKWDWQGEGVEYLWGWAELAAGMITNITLEPRFWKSRRGPALLPLRYRIEEPSDSELTQKTRDCYAGLTKLPKEHHPRFDQMPTENRWKSRLEKFAAIIEQTPAPLK